MVTRKTIVQALHAVEGIAPGTVKAVAIKDGNVSVTLAVEGDKEARERTRIEARQAVAGVEGVGAVDVNLIMPTTEEPEKPHAGHGGTGEIPLPNVRNIIAVGAGKGGVGKSTVALNLAMGLMREGYSVGLVDGDIYGPSIAQMAGIEGLPPEHTPNGKLYPFTAFGEMRVVSIANFVDPNQAMIWRGPMVHGVIRQFLSDVEWGDLDYLIFDLPPGTGDVPLTLSQSVPVTGAVLVSTPQSVALDDALRAATMYQALGISLLGFVENMSYFICDGCEKEHDIFGRGGVQRSAEAKGYRFLGQLPMDPTFRRNTDTANAADNFREDSPLAQAITGMVGNLTEAVEERLANEPAPKVMEVKG
ncbi:MAG: Mrp/NBP35 family ATP-binding protein [Phycisphaerae bacterium]